MPAISLTLPFARRSASRIPRRDLTVGAGDSLTLRLSITASDTPGSPRLDMSGLGPQTRFSVWHADHAWDYGRMPCTFDRLSTFTAFAEVQSGNPTEAVLTLERGTFAGRGRRCGYTLDFDYDGAVETIAWGALHIMPGLLLPETLFYLLDGEDIPITDDLDQLLEA